MTILTLFIFVNNFVYGIIDFKYPLCQLHTLLQNLDLTVRAYIKLCSSAASSYVKSSGLSECCE